MKGNSKTELVFNQQTKETALFVINKEENRIQLKIDRIIKVNFDESCGFSCVGGYDGNYTIKVLVLKVY